MEVGCQSYGTAEEEDGVQDVENKRNDRVASQSLVEGDGDEVEQAQHREHGHKHGVVDDGRVARVGIGNHITDQGHNEEGPDELFSGQFEVKDITKVSLTWSTRRVRETTLETMLTA